MPPESKSNEIKITRIYDAPVQVVWDAWTDPAQAAQWWGPRGFTLTTHSKSLKPGGHWSYTMHGPDGVDYPNRAVYLEVKQCAKLVYDHGASDDRPPLFRVTVLFSEIEGKTHMAMTMALPTPEAADQTREFIKKAGGNATWDRLSEYLEKGLSGNEVFVINRSFHVPREFMFKMWTDPNHFSQWLPLTGFKMDALKSDIKPGGGMFYVMSGDAGGESVKMYGRTEYIRIESPACLVYTQVFCDENGAVSRHPMAPTWPEVMLTTVKFAEEGPENTRVTVNWKPFGTVTREELAAFVAARSGMAQGWTGSFDKLEAYGLGNG